MEMILLHKAQVLRYPQQDDFFCFTSLPLSPHFFLSLSQTHTHTHVDLKKSKLKKKTAAAVATPSEHTEEDEARTGHGERQTDTKIGGGWEEEAGEWEGKQEARDHSDGEEEEPKITRRRRAPRHLHTRGKTGAEKKEEAGGGDRRGGKREAGRGPLGTVLIPAPHAQARPWPP